MLPLACQEAFDESFRNDKKHEGRYRLHGEYHGYEDGVFELHHDEYAAYLNYLEEIFAYEKKKRQEEIERLEVAMKELTEIQRRRIKMYFYDRLDYHQIAKKEKRSRTAIRDSIHLALKKIQKFF